MNNPDLGPLLAAVGTDYERALTIAERAGIDPRTAGPRLKALERQGLIESKHTQKYGGVSLYRRTPEAPPLPTALRSVEQVRGAWEIRVCVQHGVVGMSGGTFNAPGPDGSSYGVLIYAPDAAALRSLIGDLGRALEEIEDHA